MSGLEGGGGGEKYGGTTEEDPEKLKCVIQTLWKELDEVKTRSEAGEWLVRQNKELAEKCKKIEKQLYHWKNCANDARDRLARMNKAKKTSVDIFYDSGLRRVIEELTIENQKLTKFINSELNDVKGAELTKKIQEKETTNKNLLLQLENKYREIRRLQEITKNDANKRSSQDLAERYSNLQRENGELKRYLIQKNDLMVYLKSIFTNFERDMIKLFTDQYRINGNDFLKELASSKDKFPEFLTKSLLCEVGVNTDNNVTHEIGVNTSLLLTYTGPEGLEKYDSGNFSVTDDMRLVHNDLREAKITIQRLEESKSQTLDELRLLKNKLHEKEDNEKEFGKNIATVYEYNDECNRTNIQKDERIRALELNVTTLAKEKGDLKNELASWRTALQHSQEEGQHFKNEKDEIEDKCRTLEVVNLNLKKLTDCNTPMITLQQENNLLKERLQTYEDLVRNLTTMSRQQGQQQRQSRPYTDRSYTETQAGQSRSSQYARSSSAVAHPIEYNEAMRTQEFMPREPYQYQTWLEDPFKGPGILAGGVHRDSRSACVDIDSTKTDGAPKSEALSTLIESGSSRNISPSSTPTTTFPTTTTTDWLKNIRGDNVSSSRREPVEVTDSGNVSGSHIENVYTCNSCGARLPSSFYMEHVRTCVNQL